MKVFIVFLGVFLINISFLSYQGDMGRYIRCQAFLKAVAEECAAGAALYYDEDAYSEGRMCFYRDEGRKYIEYIIEKSCKEMPLPAGSGIRYEALFQDEGVEIPSVTVELTAKTEDLFRLPFLDVTEIKRESKYELPQ